MSNLFAALGFDIETEAEFGRQALDAANAGERIALPGGGEYRRWSPGAGVEMWTQVVDETVVGMNPHFAGVATMRGAVSKRVSGVAGSALDGMYQVWADPETDDPESGATTLLMDVPDFALHERLRLPVIAPVQLAGLAYELAAFADETEFIASQTGELKYAPESFVPTGMFNLDGDNAPPRPEAIFAGRVLAAGVRVNPATGNPFQWVHVRSVAGEMEVVAEPARVAGTVVVGGVVSGTIWLSGRVRFDQAEPRAPWWKRIFTR